MCYWIRTEPSKEPGCFFAVCVAWERRQHKWASPSDQKELKRIFFIFLFFTATAWGVARLPAMTKNSFGIEIFILFLLLVTLYVYTGFLSCQGCDQHSLVCLYRFPKLPRIHSLNWRKAPFKYVFIYHNTSIMCSKVFAWYAFIYHKIYHSNGLNCWNISLTLKLRVCR